MNPYLDIVIRSVSVYFFMVIALRIFGKKELSQLNTTDVILILLISNSVQNAMVGTDTSLWGGLTAAAVLFLINFILKKVLFKYKKLGSLLEDKPEILIHNGKPDYNVLSRLGITHDEMMEAAHEHGVEHLTDIKLAILEMDGNISIISGDKNLKQTHYKRRRNRKNLTTMS
ncbi:DUF421 domain-containing protein [Flavobacterium noncentrifugens]|uniref:YetF C-terminal domain-containing protein n=1 Tax=Flavobacterium noncentrifugens TaxID=1128970 RepID=A0A1G8ZYV1_9FLAO|nr:YetF domain-containing protein [Flavobacterium noncentrifugens]GEP51780.1 DUF421 domain-containing protein [Flavobacterium noncentrifugens]SDK20263.1 Protein of unknown function [Flavobacterium noncentrifugens]